MHEVASLAIDMGYQRTPQGLYFFIIIPLLVVAGHQIWQGQFNLKNSLIAFVAGSIPAAYVLIKRYHYEPQEFFLALIALVLPVTLGTAWVISKLPEFPQTDVEKKLEDILKGKT